jgi:hypothetical protein
MTHYDTKRDAMGGYEPATSRPPVAHGHEAYVAPGGDGTHAVPARHGRSDVSSSSGQGASTRRAVSVYPRTPAPDVKAELESCMHIGCARTTTKVHQGAFPAVKTTKNMQALDKG